MRKLYLGLIAVPVSIVGRVIGADTLTFIASMIAIVPLAGIIGRATEDLATHIGQRKGGLLNATMGNATELIIATFLIFGGEIEIVKLSVTGSIIGNLLLVLGIAFLLGGLRYQEQSFNAKVAGMHSASLALAVVGIMMPTVFHTAVPRAGLLADEIVSAGVAGVLIVVYLSSLVFSFVTHQEMLTTHHEAGVAGWSRRTALWVLIGATVMVALESEMLVHSLEVATTSLRIPEVFVGLILVPLVGNAAEHSSAIFLAMRNKVDTSIEIAVGSSTQIALFVLPVLVFISIVAGRPMDLFFTGFELAAVGLSAAVVAIICLDGRSNWLEGGQLIAAYLIMALASYFL